MDELAYRRYCDRGKAADDIFRAIKSMYASLSWRNAYLRAVKDGLLTKDERACSRISSGSLTQSRKKYNSYYERS